MLLFGRVRRRASVRMWKMCVCTLELGGLCVATAWLRLAVWPTTNSSPGSGAWDGGGRRVNWEARGRVGEELVFDCTAN